MAIRINLLAEAQSSEELRRRDPVKRAGWIGMLIIACVLAWASLLQARVALLKADANRLNGKIAELQSDYGTIVDSQKTLTSARQKLAALDKLSESRYLTGNLLDALQHAYVPDVRMVKLKTRFDYTVVDAKPAKTNSFKVIPATPASSTEKIVVEIEAVDASSNPGDHVNEYKETVASLDHISTIFEDADQDVHQDVRLTGLNPPTEDGSGKQYVLFTLECAYPETIR